MSLPRWEGLPELPVSSGGEGAHSARLAALELQRCLRSSGSAADRSHRRRGSHSIAAELHQPGCDAGAHQLREGRVKGLPGASFLKTCPPFHAHSCTWAEAVTTEGPVEGLRGRVGRHEHGQQCLALLHCSDHKHLLPQELWRVCGGRTSGSQGGC